jgi:hypothetical protein
MMIALISIGALLIALFADAQWRRYEKGIGLIKASLTRHGCSNIRTAADWLDFGRVRTYLVQYDDRSGQPTRNMCQINVSAESSGEILWLESVQRCNQLTKRYQF